MVRCTTVRSLQGFGTDKLDFHHFDQFHFLAFLFSKGAGIYFKKQTLSPINFNHHISNNDKAHIHPSILSLLLMFQKQKHRTKIFSF